MNDQGRELKNKETKGCSGEGGNKKRICYGRTVIIVCAKSDNGKRDIERK